MAKPTDNMKGETDDDVRDAAEQLVKIARDVGFRAPELHAISLGEAVVQMNRIAEALCLIPRKDRGDGGPR